MGRPATGSPKWRPRKRVWVVRVTVQQAGGKSRRVPVRMPGIPEHDAVEARRMALIGSEQARTSGTTTLPQGASVADFAAKWIVDREARGITTFNHDKSRLKLQCFRASARIA